MSEPIDAVHQLFIGPGERGQIGDRLGVGVTSSMKERGDLAGDERNDQRSVRELDDRKASRE
jgi:hypothetical protein